jgi:chorismate mutase
MRIYGQFLLLPSIAALGLAQGQSQPPAQAEALQRLVKTSAERLQLATQVALAKWDSGAHVEDPAREKQVIDNAVKESQEKGLDPTQVGDFFRAQIEANKVMQYALLSSWSAEGNAPAHRPVNLGSEIRPRLDQIQVRLIDELAGSAAIRSGSGCRTQVAQAVARYLEVHKLKPDTRDAVALERAMGATCTR